MRWFIKKVKGQIDDDKGGVDMVILRNEIDDEMIIMAFLCGYWRWFYVILTIHVPGVGPDFLQCS